MIIRFARGYGGQRCFYDRTGKRRRIRQYHVLGLARVVDRDGSMWRFIVGPMVICFGLRNRRGM